MIGLKNSNLAISDFHLTHSSINFNIRIERFSDKFLTWVSLYIDKAGQINLIYDSESCFFIVYIIYNRWINNKLNFKHIGQTERNMAGPTAGNQRNS